MRKDIRRVRSIEKQIRQSRELDHEAFEQLAEAAGLIVEAEAAFVRLAERDR